MDAQYMDGLRQRAEMLRVGADIKPSSKKAIGPAQSTWGMFTSALHGCVWIMVMQRRLPQWVPWVYVAIYSIRFACYLVINAHHALKEWAGQPDA